MLDLRPYLVKILWSDKKTINSTGFFCHPDGYILTCYHVIEPYLKENKDEVPIIYQDDVYQTKICKNYCLQDPDIAVLKLIKPPPLSFLPLDVHKRWNSDDQIYSFGYPKGYFQKSGINISGAIGGFTTVDNTKVIQITGLNLTNVNPGYSGAPVFHLQTNKVIGLIHAKYKKTQAFFIPLDPLFKIWLELKDFHDIFKKLRLKLADEAEEKLKEKLKGTPFIPLNLEEGVVKEEKPGHQRQPKEERAHGREWKAFNLDKLFPPDSSYILSSDVGTGKTTFCCWLTKELIKKTDRVPILMTCAEFERKNLDNWDELKEKLIGNYTPAFLKIDLEHFFDTYFKKQKVVFLFDGLDQISSGEYLNLVKKIFEIAFSNLVLISSRPSAVLAMETDPKINFLRLKPFSVEAQKDYFGKSYEEARRLSALACDLTCIPMLAYMVRILIEEGKTKGVFTRTDIYKRFLNHIIYEHDPNMAISVEKFQFAHNVKETLKRLSFEALALKEPEIQKIPIKLVNQYKTDSSMKIEDLLRFGLVNIILEKGDITQPYLFFTHQSLQEFLAAQYANEHEHAFKKIIAEIWAPKWKEVIKFLAGLRGEEIIREIYPDPERDNVIHSRLFLAAECTLEIKKISQELREKLENGLRKLMKIIPFEVNATKALEQLGEIHKLKSLLRNKDGFVRGAAIKALAQLKERIDDETIKEITGRLRDENGDVRRAAYQCLKAFYESGIHLLSLQESAW